MLIFECLPVFLFSLFWPPPFSISLSLSLACSFLYFFLLVFLFCFLLVPCFCLFLCFSVFFAFVSWKEHQNIQLQSFFINPFSSFWFPVLFSLWNPFFLSLLHPDFKLCFCSTSMFLVVKTQKTPIFGQEGGCNKTFFFMSLCFAKCDKLSFWGPFLGKFWLMLKKHYKLRYFSTFLKAKNDHF